MESYFDCCCSGDSSDGMFFGEGGRAGEKGAQEAGKMRAEGKDYIVHDGDIMNFLFNV